MALKAKSQSISVPSFLTVVVIASEKLVNVRFFQDFPSAPVAMTLVTGHSNWYDLKGLAKQYYCAKFQGCSGHGV